MYRSSHPKSIENARQDRAHVLELPITFGMYGTPFDDEGLPIFAPGASLPVSFCPEFDDELGPGDFESWDDELAWLAESEEAV